MASNTLFEPPIEFTNRVNDLKDRGIKEAELLLQVELGFALMERLGLDDEPITGVWAILSGMFVRHPRLQNLSAEDRRAIANARQIIPFSSRFNWLNALRDYIRNIPEGWRNYDFDLQDLDDLIINAAKNLQQEANQHIVEGCLSATLHYRSRMRDRVEAEAYYQFESETQSETVNLQVNFTQEQVITTYPLRWFDRIQARLPVAIDLADLEAEAIFLDNREEILARQYSWSNAAKGNWTRRFSKLNYHKVRPPLGGALARSGNIVDRQTAPTLNIDGFTHIAGMVASGKSTLSLLLASNIIRNRPDLRITIVVGDTQSAIKIANQINWWFCDNPETDDPVAVPILGRSRRDSHLQSFANSDDYLNHLQRGQAHWGERWLSVVCPLQARISQSDRNNILNGKPLIPGTEPCHTLRKAPKDQKKSPNSNGSFCFCPLFDRCPSQQAYRDMPKARVWITTPGAMSIGGMPYHYELRPIKIGELVYEQSDIVVFDEADTIIEWFDKVYAEQLTLTDSSRSGVFDKIGVKTEQSNRNDSVRSPLKSRWRSAERDAQTAVEATLTNLTNELGHEILQKWVQQGYFTPHVLFYKLARRLSGLEEFNFYGRSEQQLNTDERDIQSIMDCFDDFLKDDPVLGRSSSSELSTTSLLEIIRRINSTGESATDKDINDDCQNWITTFFPNTQNNLNRLKTELDNLRNQQDSKILYPYLTKEEDLDTLVTLAHRLQFTLTITLLDRHVNIVFYEWQNRPSNINEPSPHKKMPMAMMNILPLPVTGRQFGTYYSAKDSDTLSLFAYSNIGRDYVLNFHRLLTDFDGRRGANVLALSGTSYLPDSTAFHVSNPQGVLMPEASAQLAIKQSQFKFIPQFDERNKSMRMSGNLSDKKLANLKFQELAKSLITNEGSNHLFLELQALKELGKTDPELWQDRDRILVLVNSYEQAKWVADEMRQCRSDINQQIYHLVGDAEQTKDGKSQPGELRRADIETFGYHQGKILVAPTSSIGRGFNILNSNGKAAFGAVYFLTRPFPHPHDTQAIAQEMNRRAYEWLEKEDFIAWRQGDGVAHRAELLRKTANTYWRSVEQRSYYKTLRDNKDLCAFPRYDLAATTLGRIIQAVGRLIRGGVPFRGYFVDSAWADNSARKLAAKRVGDDPESIENDTEENSLLVATILRICDYAVDEDSVGNALYKPLADALEIIEDVSY